jgi:hypothetical protein
MRLPRLRRPRFTYANVAATTALVIAVGGGAIAFANDPATVIHGCVTKPGVKGAGTVTILGPGKSCNKKKQKPLSWNKQGIQGEPGVAGSQGEPGPAGPQGEPGAGSPDTPQQVLVKLVQVDGEGSGLDSSFLDGINSTGFLRNNGKAVDADNLDGLNSTSFVRRGTASGGTIGLAAIAAGKCSDVQLGIGSLKVGDIIVLNVASGDSLPKNLTLQELDIPADGLLNVRVCNGSSTASLADAEIKLRWYAFRP